MQTRKLPEDSMVQYDRAIKTDKCLLAVRHTAIEVENGEAFARIC
jgi:hypothetical protein